MTLSFALFVFCNAWVVTMFFVAPFFLRPNPDRTPVEYAAAPASVPWKKLLIANTLAAVAATLLLALVIQSGWFALRGPNG